MSEKTCPYCGASIEQEALFCFQCGKELLKICPECGEKVEPNARFCLECGYSFFPAEEKNREEKQPQETGSHKEKNRCREPFYTKWWFWLSVALIVAVIGLLLKTGGESRDPAITDESSSSVTESFAESESKETETAHGSSTIEEFRDSMDSILADAFGADSFETELDSDKKMYYIYVWIDDVSKGLEQARAGDENTVTDWNAMVGRLMDSCGAIREQMDDQGLKNWSVSLSLLDEVSKSEVFVITKDGDVIFDVLVDGDLE